LLIKELANPNHGLGHVLMMHEYGADRKPGVPKTKQTTEMMVHYCSELMRDNLFRISELLMGGESTHPQAMLDKLYKHCAEFKCEVKYNKNQIFSIPAYKWCGPQDDLLISLMTAAYWFRMFSISQYEGYKNFKALASIG